MLPDSSMVVVSAAPVEVVADAVTSEAGTGGCRDVISVIDFAVAVTMGTGSDYICTPGDMSEVTVGEKVVATKFGCPAAPGEGMYEVSA